MGKTEMALTRQETPKGSANNQHQAQELESRTEKSETSKRSKKSEESVKRISYIALFSFLYRTYMVAGLSIRSFQVNGKR